MRDWQVRLLEAYHVLIAFATVILCMRAFRLQWTVVHASSTGIDSADDNCAGRLGQAYTAGYNCNTEEELQQVCGVRM